MTTTGRRKLSTHLKKLNLTPTSEANDKAKAWAESKGIEVKFDPEGNIMLHDDEVQVKDLALQFGAVGAERDLFRDMLADSTVESNRLRR